MNASTPIHPAPAPTGASVRRLLAEADALLEASAGLADLDQHLAEIAQDAGSLPEPEREQLHEVLRLMTATKQDSPALRLLRRDASFSLTPSSNRMALLLAIEPAVAGGRSVTVPDILGRLKARGVTRGVSLRAVQEAVATAQAGQAVEAREIVQGRPAQPGRDGSYQLFARLGPDQPLAAVAGGRPPAPGQLLLCAAGDVVLRAIPPTPGRPGYDALGNALQAPQPAMPSVEVGANVTAEGGDLVAQTPGVVVFDGRRIEVRKVLVVSQELTIRESPLEFDGEVHVRAAVRSGAQIKASGSVVVEGPVEAASIESAQGDVELRHGVVGRSRATITAGRDILARFAEGATLRAGRDIRVGVGVLHSLLVAGRAIHVSRGRGQLIGGVAMAGGLVEARQLGSPGDVPTEVLVGLSPEAMRAIGELDAQAARLARRRDDCAALADRMERAVGDPTRLKAEELAVFTRLRQTQLVCGYRLRRLEAQRTEALARSAQGQQGRVDVLDQLMPKVRIRIGQGTLESHETLDRCRVAFDPRTGRLAVQRLV